MGSFSQSVSPNTPRDSTGLAEAFRIVTTVLLGPRLKVSDKQLFREVKKKRGEKPKKMVKWREVILQVLQDTL